VIAPEPERPRSGAGARFFDAVAVELSDAERGLFGLVVLVRRPNAGTAAGLALLFADGRAVISHSARGASDGAWEDVELDGLRLRTSAPLGGWGLTVSVPGASLELEAAAVSPPLDLSGPDADAIASATSLARYEQRIVVVGAAELDGGRRDIGAAGRRVHAWGPDEWDGVEGWRALWSAAPEGPALSVACARPAGSEGHGAEIRSAHRLDPAAEPKAFGETRVSTVYGAGGLPVKADVELSNEGDEVPRRVPGEAVCGTSLALGGPTLTVAFLRWALEGGEAYGSYCILRRA
jgi:hypothetical protein